MNDLEEARLAVKELRAALFDVYFGNVCPESVKELLHKTERFTPEYAAYVENCKLREYCGLVIYPWAITT